MPRPPVTKYEGIDGWYRYRNVRIVRNDSERGYSGYWTAKVTPGDRSPTDPRPALRLSAATRSVLLDRIDTELNRAGLKEA